MRAFRPKSFRQQATIEVKRGDGLTPEQHKALQAEFDRRIATLKETWRACCDGRCRRHRQCFGHSFACKSGSGQRWTKRQYRWLRREVLRRPPRV